MPGPEVELVHGYSRQAYRPRSVSSLLIRLRAISVDRRRLSEEVVEVGLVAGVQGGSGLCGEASQSKIVGQQVGMQEAAYRRQDGGREAEDR